jgi:hypothetical protein
MVKKYYFWRVFYDICMFGVSSVMVDIFETSTMLVRFLFSYFLLFVWIPSFVIRFQDDQSSFLDKLFISLTHSTLFFMIAVHMLVGIRLLETFSLLAIVLIGIISVLYLGKNLAKKKAESINLLTSFFDLADDSEKRKIAIKKIIASLKEKLFSQFQAAKQAMIKHPVLVVGYLLVFGIGMTDRFRYSLSHLAFVSSDSYVHLGWSKFMASMQIYMDGVYPFGFESILASLFRVVQLDMYVAIRFMGAITALLMILSLVYALRKMVGKDYTTILLTVFMLFFSADMMIGNDVILWRQLSALSMEFAAIFLFPGITFFYLFFKTRNRSYLLLAAESYAITAFTHPFVTVTMTFAFLAVGFANFRKLIKDKTIFHILLYMGIAGFIGILSPLIGLLAGKPFHGSSLNYVRTEMSTNADGVHAIVTLITFAREQPFILMLYVVTGVYFIGWLIYRTKYPDRKWSTTNHSPLLMALIFHFMMIVSYLAPKWGLPTLVPVDRQPVFLAMAGALLFGICVGLVVQVISREKLRKALHFCGCLTIMCWVWLVPGQKLDFPPGDFHQYDEAIRAYLDIKEDYPFKNWNIISPVDELGIVYGYGYHYELWEFVRDLDNPDVKELKFTTPYVFLYVEKVPIDIMSDDFRSITPEDAAMPFPIATNSRLTEFYYGSVHNRRVLQAKAYYWAEEYIKNNKDMKVYMDTPNMKIYEIHQRNPEVVIKK